VRAGSLIKPMHSRAQRRPRLVGSEDHAGAEAPRARSLTNQVDLVYERIEQMLVNCQLKPGRFMAMQDLQELVHFGRTPVLQAVSRLAADTLVIVRPRHGVQIAPIDLARERGLLPLRRDTERFVIRLAAERSGPSQRNQMLHLMRLLREQSKDMTINKFNVVDRKVDQLIMAAAGEPFVEHTLRPLHTIFRRIGWLHHTYIARGQNLQQSIDCHVALLDAVANRHVDKALAAMDDLIGFVDSMFDVLEHEIDPSLLDCSLAYLNPH
jgi:DNA-binding GntR family transcriptional regulator